MPSSLRVSVTLLGGVGQRKGVGAGDRLLGIGRQIEGRELPGGIRRDADAADPRRDKTIAAFDAARPRIGVELRAQLVDAGDGHGAVGGDVLPAIGQRAGEIGRPACVPDERAGLEQVGTPGAAVGDAEVGAAAGQRKARQRDSARCDSRRRPRCRRCCWSCCWSRAPCCRRWSASRHSPPPTRSSAARTDRPWRRLGEHAHRRRARASTRWPCRRVGVGRCASAMAAAADAPSPRPAMNGSVSTPMNWFIASKVVCCEPVAVSPETCVRPAGVSPPNTSGMPPLVLKKLMSALATFCWLPLRPPSRAAARNSARDSDRHCWRHSSGST